MRVLICLREQRETETGWAIVSGCREYCFLKVFLSVDGLQMCTSGLMGVMELRASRRREFGISGGLS